MGRPLPQVDVRVADSADGSTQPLNVTGEVLVRGYQVMAGYFELPEATAAAIDADGWLHTGDLGSMDAHGNLRIQGRLKEMIIRSGENRPAGTLSRRCRGPRWARSRNSFSSVIFWRRIGTGRQGR